jgi:hypothetical protein
MIHLDGWTRVAIHPIDPISRFAERRGFPSPRGGIVICAFCGSSSDATATPVRLFLDGVTLSQERIVPFDLSA